jgi:hypothetical protein
MRGVRIVSIEPLLSEEVYLWASSEIRSLDKDFSRGGFFFPCEKDHRFYLPSAETGFNGTNLRRSRS